MGVSDRFTGWRQSQFSETKAFLTKLDAGNTRRGHVPRMSYRSCGKHIASPICHRDKTGSPRHGRSVRSVVGVAVVCSFYGLRHAFAVDRQPLNQDSSVSQSSGESTPTGWTKKQLYQANTEHKSTNMCTKTHNNALSDSIMCFKSAIL